LTALESTHPGLVQTVLGPVEADALGITSAHEHVLFDMSVWSVSPPEGSEESLFEAPVNWENLHLIRADRPCNSDNMRQTDEALAVDELRLFRSAGGGTIVELSSVGLGRDPTGLARVARATGVNIVMGCGYYVEASHPPELAERSVDDIAEEMIKDLTVGVGETGIRSGIIGEIGCSAPLGDGERKVLRAGAIAQRESGAPLNLHPSIDDDLVLENMRILREAGADLSRVAVSHVDQNGYGPETIHALADSGCYLELDAFGHLGYPHMEQGRLLNLTGDLERVELIMGLIDAGYLDQILIGQDVCFKDCLTVFGGFGYAHIVRNVARLMRAKGLSESQTDRILVQNPSRFLRFH